MKQVEITIDENGDIKADAKCGFAGIGCMDELEALLDGMGTETDRKKKAEFYVKASNKTQKKQGLK